MTYRRNLLALVCGIAIVLSACGDEKASERGLPGSSRTPLSELPGDTARYAFDTAFVFAVGNTERSRFGFEERLGPLGRGPRNIALANDRVFVSDSFHDNVKVINVADGALTTLEYSAERRDPPIDDIFVSKDWIAISNWSRTVYLRHLRDDSSSTLSLPEGFWRTQQFFDTVGGTVALFCPPRGEAMIVWPIGRRSLVRSARDAPVEIQSTVSHGSRTMVLLTNGAAVSVDTLVYNVATEPTQAVAFNDRTMAILRVKAGHVIVLLFRRE